MKKILLIIYIFFSTLIYSQEDFSRIKSFHTVYSRLMQENKNDSINIILNNFSELKNLTPLENQAILFFKADYLKTL